jgi:hypothetical protein
MTRQHRHAGDQVKNGVRKVAGSKCQLQVRDMSEGANSLSIDGRRHSKTLYISFRGLHQQYAYL